MSIGSRRKWIFLSLIALTGLSGAGPGQADDDFKIEEGFTSLLNGKDLTGWRVGRDVLDGKTASSDGRFEAKDGALLIIGAPKIEDINTVREFNRDFVLRLEFRAAPMANSGLYLRGKQLQVRDYATVGPYKELKRYNNGGWNAIEVKVKSRAGGAGALAECSCNGEVLESSLPVPAKGGIGLQSETGRIEYRRIRIKEQP